MSEDQKKLLENEEVREEINKHLWIESEKAGYDIGFEKAAEDWMNRYSEGWLKFHMPQAQSQSQSSEKKTRTKRTTVEKTRRASTYI